MKKPYWKIIISHFENKNYISNGLTIPYLIGARQNFKTLKDDMTVNEFVQELVNSSVKTTIMKCGNINEYVIGLLDLETEKLINDKYSNLYPQFGNLHLQGFSRKLSNSKINFLNTLENEYQGLINKGQYSKIRGNWSQFTKTDELRIEEAIRTYDQHVHRC